jgi:Lon protease-like protein
MPMFPLGTVLLPGGVLPLHVFEPRYRAMVQHCLENGREFGVVLITRGHEVGGGDVRTSIGTVARMVQVAELADGRYAMITVGMRRIRVREWLVDDPYPRAQVEDWPDAAGRDVPDIGAVTARVRRLAALALELGDAVADPSQDLSDEPECVSYQLATLAPIGDADRYRLLSEASAAERFELLSRLLDDAEAALTFRLSAGET